VRSLDLDPFSPIGIDPVTMRFLDALLVACVLADSPPDTPGEIATIARNQFAVAERGREPGLRLVRGGDEVDLVEWGLDVVRQCAPIAARLDAALGGDDYAAALAAAEARLRDASLTPSARVLREMRERHHDSYLAFALAQSLAHRDRLRALPFAPAAHERLLRMAEESTQAQRDLEASDDLSFEAYRRQYLGLDVMSGLTG
jgi:glutamate--cysteine ligase